jgi:hypothetical protein
MLSIDLEEWKELSYGVVDTLGRDNDEGWTCLFNMEGHLV